MNTSQQVKFPVNALQNDFSPSGCQKSLCLGWLWERKGGWKCNRGRSIWKSYSGLSSWIFLHCAPQLARLKSENYIHPFRLTITLQNMQSRSKMSLLMHLPENVPCARVVWNGEREEKMLHKHMQDKPMFFSWRAPLEATACRITELYAIQAHKEDYEKKILWCRRRKLREKMAGQESRTSKLNMRLEFEGLWAELAYLFRECLKLVFWVHVLPNAFHIIPVLNYAVLHRVAYGKEASVLLAKEDKQGSKSTSSCSIWIFHTLIS